MKTGFGTAAPDYRPPAPAWNGLQDFRAHVHVPRWTLPACITIFFGLIFCASALFDGSSTGRALFGLALLSAGLIWLAWDRLGRERYLRRLHRQALARGLTAHAYATRFEMPKHDAAPRPALVLIATRVSSAQAAHLLHAFDDWCESLSADGKAYQSVLKQIEAREPSFSIPELLGVEHTTLALTEILGPEASGAWLVTACDSERDSPWRMLLPTRDGGRWRMLPLTRADAPAAAIPSPARAAARPGRPMMSVCWWEYGPIYSTAARGKIASIAPGQAPSRFPASILRGRRERQLLRLREHGARHAGTLDWIHFKEATLDGAFFDAGVRYDTPAGPRQVSARMRTAPALVPQQGTPVIVFEDEAGEILIEPDPADRTPFETSIERYIYREASGAGGS
jgi:hypothetical protein